VKLTTYIGSNDTISTVVYLRCGLDPNALADAMWDEFSETLTAAGVSKDELSVATTAWLNRGFTILK
jgi:hypothetical protein